MALLLGPLAALPATGCRNAATPTPGGQVPAGTQQSLRVEWGPQATCTNEAVNDFVRQAVEASAAGDYERYRLLWSVDRQPASRKRFEQFLSAVSSLKVTTLKPLRLRRDGELLPQEQPVYLFHAHIKVKEEVRRRAPTRMQDRDVILLVIQDGEDWRFQPAPPEVKEAFLAHAAADEAGP